MYSIDSNPHEDMLKMINEMLAFGLFEGDGIILWFKLSILVNLLVVIFIQGIGFLRVSITRADFGAQLFAYLCIDLIKGFAVSLTIFASPLALIFYCRAFHDALTACWNTGPDDNTHK